MKASCVFKKLGPSRHNDRDFDIKKSKYIKNDRTENNVYLSLNGNDERIEWKGQNRPESVASFATEERNYYIRHFKEALDRKNRNYRSKGKIKQIKTIAEYIKAHPGQEIILQYGNVDEPLTDTDLLLKCGKQFTYEVEQKYGANFILLNLAEHLDEESGHIHLRYIWQYIDKYGFLDTCMEKALEQMGIERPDLSKPSDHVNNRLQTFTKEMQQLWIDIGREHGLILDDLPEKGKQVHISVEEYRKKKVIENELENMKNDMSALENKTVDMELKKNELKNKRNDLEEEIRDLEDILTETRIAIISRAAEECKKIDKEKAKTLQRYFKEHIDMDFDER